MTARYQQECFFKNLCRVAGLSVAVVVIGLLLLLFIRGVPGFWRVEIAVEMVLPETISRDSLRQAIAAATLQQPSGGRAAPLLADGTLDELRRRLQDRPLAAGLHKLWLPASSDINRWWRDGYLSPTAPWRAEDLATLKTAAILQARFNAGLLTQGDSRHAETAGLYNGLLGSLLVLLVAIGLTVPIALGAAIYLTELGKGRLVRLCESQISNLAAVPSIIFGLLGLGILLNVFGLPRSSALVGGITLGLLSLPLLIVTFAAALRAVPQEYRDAALALGASRRQTIYYHVVPYATARLLTGLILAIARIIGETAPLLLVGMVAFIGQTSPSLTGATTTLPVQIFLWYDRPEHQFVEKASAAIVVMLAVVLLLNLVAFFWRDYLDKQQRCSQ